LEKQLQLDELEAYQAAAEIPDPPNIITTETPDEPMLQEQSSDNQKISQLTLDQKKELVEKYNHTDYLKVGTYVDAHDSTHQYLFAQVVEIDPNGLAQVCFDGWSKKWNSWLKIKSIKIRPFRTEAEGYSG
jgi:hypothetical protein